MIEDQIQNDSLANLIFANSSEGLLITNGNGKIRYANPKVLSMFGYEYDQLVGQPIEILVPRNIHSKHIRLREGFEKSPSNRPMGVGSHLLGQHFNGKTFPVEVSLSPFVHKGDKYVLSFVTDISIRKLQEEKLKNTFNELDKSSTELKNLNRDLEAKVNERTLELADSIKKLQKSEKELHDALVREKEVNALKSKFISTASHEFRTPMATILSSLSLIESYQGSPVKQEKHFLRIRKSVDYLLKILKDLLTIEKTETSDGRFETEDISINDIVHDVINDLIPVYNKPNQKININYKENIVFISNEYYLRNVLINIIGNALKFSGSDGVIDITLSKVANEIIIKVQDDGIGIPEHEQKNIWERFYRGNNTTQTDGTGLGLYIAKKNTEILKGSISFESTVNKGTIFIIKLPSL